MNTRMQKAEFVWKVVYTHVIAYFIAGLFGMFVMNYKELYLTDSLSLLMRPTTDPMVPLGPALQVLRGLLIAAALYPLRKVFLEERGGYRKLGTVILVFSLLSTIGPTPGSFDGYIYTTMPPAYQALGYPEAILYILLFLGILQLSNRCGHRKTMRIVPVILVLLIVLCGVGGAIVYAGLI